MYLGLAVSVLLHAAILAWALISIYATPPLKPPEDVPIEVAIVSPDAITRLRQGSRRSKELETQPKESPAKEPPKKETLKKIEPAAAPPPPAPEPPKPDEIAKKLEQDRKAEELRVVEEKRQAEEQRAAEQKKAEELRIAEDKRKAEEQKVAEEKKAEEQRKIEEELKAEEEKKVEEQRAAEARRKEEERKVEEQRLAEERRKAEEERKKKEADAKKKRDEQKRLAELKRQEEAKKKQFDAERIAALLNKVPDKAAPAAAAPPPQTPTLNTGRAAGAPEGRDKVLTASEQSLLLNLIVTQVKRCWTVPAGLPGADTIIVTLRIRFNPDGSVVGEPQVRGSAVAANAQLAAENARRAVLACSPYRLPPEKYAGWKAVELDFDPRDMF